MTAPRRQRKSRRLPARDPEKWEPVFGQDHAQNNKLERDGSSKKSRFGLVFFLALAVPGLGSLLKSVPISAATTERVVSDPRTGLAMNGFDPVAYFTDGVPKLGRPELELSFAGVVWRFRNEGNRAAFVADPQVYMPQFGGYDPVSVARGSSAPGHPELWTIAEHRLYLFYSAAARDAFAGNPGPAIDAAERAWPAVLRRLAP